MRRRAAEAEAVVRSDGDGASFAGSNGDKNGGCAPANVGRACSSLPARSLATKICQKRASWSGESEGTRDAAALALTVAKTSGERRRTAELRDEIQSPQPGRVERGRSGQGVRGFPGVRCSRTRMDDGKNRKEASGVPGKPLRVQGVLGEHEVD